MFSFQKSLLCAANLAGALFALGGCSTGEMAPMPLFKPSAPHPSPFLAQKVILTAPEAASIGPRVGENGAKPMPAGQALVATVNNVCARQSCPSEGSVGSESISCFFANHPEHLQTLDTQIYAFTLPQSQGPEELKEWADSDPCIVGVSNDLAYESLGFNDSHANQQAAYFTTTRLIAGLAELSTERTEAVRVAVIDSGVGLHPDLGGPQDTPGVITREDIRSQASKLDPQCTPGAYTNEYPSNTHGTFVAGVLAATPNNQMGVAGVAHNAKVISLAVGNCRGQMSTAEIGNAMLRAQQLGAEVVNLSLGGGSVDDPAVRHALVNLLNSKAVVVASAGNSFRDLRDTPTFPAVYSKSYPGFITVGWGAQNGELYRGNEATSGADYSPEHVLVLAPGTNMVSTTRPGNSAGYLALSGDYALGSGSSFSAPMVAGATALAIGYMKKLGLQYDEASIAYIVTQRGVRFIPALEPYVQGGALLDFQTLANTLKFLRESGANPRPLEVGRASGGYDSRLKQPYAQFSVSWDLAMSHYGARLGVFDLAAGCNYSKPCLIQDFELGSNQGSKNIRLSRNELLPMLANLSDPEFALHVGVAVYYDRGTPIYGLDAVTRVNIRDLDFSSPSSPFLGKVTALRSDMRFVYIQGWACLSSSNKAVPVQVIDANGNPIPTSYAYEYSLMVPHAGTLDNGLFPSYHGDTEFNSLGRLHFSNQITHKAGLEANPQLISQCNTLTAAHGFEFAIPLSEIRSRGLGGKLVSVRATNPNRASTRIPLPDESGRTQYTVPLVNFQPSVPRQLAVTRGGGGATVGGYVCSESPSPISVELSFSRWGYSCRLGKQQGFPGNRTSRCNLLWEAELPLMHISDGDRNNFYRMLPATAPEVGQQLESNLELTPTQMAKSLAQYPTRWPNVAVGIPWSYLHGSFENGLIRTPYVDFLKSKNMVDGNGRRFGGVFGGKTRLSPNGSSAIDNLARHVNDRSGPALRMTWDWEHFWDYYDVGDYFSPSVVAYSINTKHTIGEYLHRTFGVQKIMRETKKYEVPLGSRSQILANQVFSQPAKGSGSCPWRFDMSVRADGLLNQIPNLQLKASAFLEEGQTSVHIPEIDDIHQAMLEVPLDIRLFQDGVLLLHLLSDYGSQVYPVKTLGRGN